MTTTLVRRETRLPPPPAGAGGEFDRFKRDPRDRFVRLGGFHGAYDDPRFVTFRPHDAGAALQGNGEPRPNYTVRIR